VDGPDADRIVVFQDGALFHGSTCKGTSSSVCGSPRADSGEEGARGRVPRDGSARKFARARIHELSGGMKQRVALARALVLRPRILLMDEPFAALDAQTREEMESVIQELWLRSGATILFVTHDIQEAFCSAIGSSSSHTAQEPSGRRVERHPRRGRWTIPGSLSRCLGCTIFSRPTRAS